MSIALLGATSRSSFAATYYVDQNNPSCSNSGAGSAAQPYCTISAAVSARSAAGNTIIVRPGIYREQVTVAGSGAAGNPLVIEASGPGVYVYGSTSLGNTSQWALSSGTVYVAASVTAAPVVVIADGQHLLQAASATTPAALPAGQWKYVSGQGLYVNLGGANPGSRQAEVGARNYGFRLDRRSYVTIRGFEVRNTNDRNIYLTGPLNNTIIEDNRLLLGGKNGFAAVSCSAIVVRDNYVAQHLDHGILLQTTYGSTLEGNQSTDNHRPGTRAANGIYMTGSDNNRLVGNRTWRNQDSGVNLTGNSSENLFFNNISWLNGDHGYDHLDAQNNVHFHGIAYRNYKDGYSFEGNSPGGKVYNSIGVENGVAVAPADGSLEFNLWVDDNSSVGFQSEYNIWWNSNPTIHSIKYIDTRYLTVSAFTAATGQDAHSITANPVFTDSAGANFRLRDGSPAIDRANSGLANWPATDITGIARIDDPATPNNGAGPTPYAEIGPYEFAPNTPPVAHVSVDPDNGIPPLPVIASGAASTDEGVIVSYTFDFGDGTVVGPQSSPTANHTYQLGEWALKLTVVDNRGGVDTASVPVVVTANLVGNPSFESNTTGWAPTTGSTLSRVSGGQDGAFSAQVQGPSTGTATFSLNDSPNWINVTNAVNTRYRFTAWVRSLTHTGRIKLQLREFNNGVLQATSQTAEIPLTTSWQLISVDHLSRMINSTLDLQIVNRPNVVSELFQVDNVTARVVQLDRAPAVTAPPTATATELQPLGFQITALDPDGEPAGLSADFTGLPVGHNATFVPDANNTSGAFTWTPTYQDARVQPYAVIFRASNTLVGADTTLITVNNVDPLPVVNSPTAVGAQEGSVVSFQVTASDPDSSAITTLTASFANLPAGHNATFTPAAGNASGTFTWTPSFTDAPGAYRVIFTATNTSSASDTTTITVSNVDLAPVLFAPPTFVAGEAAASVLTFNVADPDSQAIDSLKADLSGLPAGHNAVFTTSANRRIGTLTWTPAPATPPGPYRVFFTAGNALVSRDTTDIVVNRRPVITAPAATTVGETQALSLTVSVADADGDTIQSLTANLSNLPAGHNAVFTPNANRTSGTLTWTPTSSDGRVAPYAVTFTANSTTLSGTATTQITVDQPPDVGAPATVTVTETNALTVNVTASDPDGQPISSLTANLSGLPAGHNAVFTAAADQRSGTLTWTPTASDGRIPPYSVTFTATNALSGASSTSITVDQPPVVVVAATVTGSETAPLSVNVTASDPDGQPLSTLTANLAGLPAGHNAVFTPAADNASGTLTWTPTYNDSGAYTVSFTGANALSSGSASTSIGIANVDRAPILVSPATQSVGEGEPLSMVVTVTDADGDGIASLTADLSGLPAGHDAVFTPAADRKSGTLTWRPQVGTGRPAPYSVSFQAQNALSANATTAITVDRHPVVTAPATASVEENQEIVLSVTATDPDGQAITSLTADLTGLPAGHNAVFTPGAGNTSGTLRWTPNYFAAPGPHTIRFVATNALSGSATTSVSVTNHDRAPVLDCPAVAMGGERNTISIAVTAIDPDLEPITYFTADLASLPSGSNATFTPSPDKSSGVLSWTPRSGDGDASPYIVTFMAGNAIETANATAVIVDRYPRITAPATASVVETSTVIVNVSVADPDNDEVLSLSADLSELPAGHNARFTSSANNLSGTLIWTPTYDDARATPYRVRFIASNALAETTATLFTVTGRDRPPIVTVPPSTIGGENSQITVNVAASDLESDAITQLTADLSQLPSGHNATFTPAAGNQTGVLSWTPTPAEAPGPYNVGFTAVANGLSTSSTISIRVDRHPVITGPTSVTANENSPLSVSFTVDDPDADAIGAFTANLSALPAGHNAVFTTSADRRSGTLTWTPTFNDSGGPYHVSITASNALSVTAGLDLRVANTDRPAVITAVDSVMIAENATVTVTVGASDPDGDAIASLTANLSALPAGHDAVFTSNASHTSGTLTWKPKTGDGRLTPYDVVFSATNAITGTKTTGIKVDQRPIVTLTPGSVTVGEGTLVTIGVTAVDPDGQPITFLTANLSALPSGHNAVFTTSADKSSGTLTWTPSYSDFRVAPYTVTITASNALSAASAATIRVNNTDRAPVITAPTTMAGVGGSLVTVSISAVDPDGESISSLSADLSGFPAGHGAVFTENASHTGGTLSWTPDLTVPRGPHRVTFTATNALPGSASTDVSVDQRPVVTAPATANASEGAEIAFDITASDLNADAITSLTANLSGLPAGHNAVFTPNANNTGGHFSWTPGYSDAGGPYAVSFTAANALSGNASVQVSVANVDRAPIVSAPATRTTAEGAVMSISVTAADPDGQAIASLTADLSQLPAGHNAVFTPNASHTGGTLTWTPSYVDAGGPYSVTFTASNAMSGAQSTAITVTNTDRAPVVVAPASVTGGETQLITIEVTASDPDGQSISFLTADLAGFPAGNNAVFTTNASRTAGTLTWTPTFDDGRLAPYNVTFTAFNGMAGTFTTAVTVTDDNRAPVVTAPATVSVTENSPITVNVTASDPDGEAIGALTADLSAFPAGNRPVFTPNANATAGTLTWTPNFTDGRPTPYEVVFNASNSSNGAKVTAITVNNLDRLPVVTAPATAIVVENHPISIQVSASDPDGEAITSFTADFSALPAGHGASFTAGPGNTTGTFSWTPSSTAVRANPYSIVFRAINALTGSSTTALTVQPDNLPPVAALSATPSAVVAGSQVTLSAAGSTDSDGTIATYTFDFGDGQTQGPQASATASHVYAAGFWTARVITIDNLGGRDTATVDVNANLTNLVTNFGFETNTTGWAANGTVTLARVAGGHSGGFQLRLTGGSSATAAFGTHDNPNVVASVAGVGRRYRFGAWVRSDAHTGRLNLEVREFSGTSTQVGTTVISSPVTLSSGWQYLTTDYVVTTAGTNLDLRAICSPNASNSVWFLDDVSIALVPLGDQAPVVVAPAAASVVRNNVVTVTVTASDPDGQALTSLLSNLSGLPAGHNAVFTPNANNTSGTLTWTPRAADIRETPYNVTFTAANALSGTATVAITVTDSSALVNLVSNPGFETDLSGWLAYTGTMTRVAGGRTGGFSARLTSTATGSFGIDDAVLTVARTPIVGARYRFSAWIRSDNSTRGVKIRIYEKTASGSAVGSTFYSPEVLLSPTWKEITVDYLARGANNSIDFKITNYPSVANEVFFLDDVFVAYVPPGPIAPVLTAPVTTLGAEGAPVTVNVTATSQDGQPISSLTADLSALPAGHNAVFTPGANNTTGTLTWTPAAAHASATPYSVTFRAVGSLTATRSTAITVADTTGGTNLVTNFGFDTNTTGWAANGTVTLSRLTSNTRSGAGVLQLRGGSSATALFGTHDNPNVVATHAGVGRVYRFGGWVRGLTATDTGSVALEVREFSGTSTQVGTTRLSPAAKLTMSWQYLTADFTVTTAGTNLDLRAICTPKKANETWLLDDVSIRLLPSGPPPPQAPVVTASPDAPSVLRNHVVTVNVAASDADGPAITSLTADLSRLPAGHDAVFTPSGTTAGTFTWTPKVADIRPEPYLVVFTAANALSGSDTTAITVTDSAVVVNLVGNPGFETDLTGWAGYSTTNVTRVAGGRSGGFSCRVQGTSTSSFGIDDTPNWVASVPAIGTVYRFTAWIRSDNSTRAVKLRIYEMQGTTQIGSTFYSPQVFLSPTWQKVTVDYTTQRAGTTLSLRITDYPTATGEVFFIDDVSIEQLPSGGAITATTQTDAVAGTVVAESVPRVFGNDGGRFAFESAASLALQIEGADGADMEGFVPRVTLAHGSVAVEGSVLAMGEDRDRNGFEETAASFSADDLRRVLDGAPAGTHRVPVTIVVAAGEARRTIEAEIEVERTPLVFEAKFAPNPFKGTGTLTFAVTRRGPVRAEVFDVNGRRARLLMEKGDLEPGRYHLPVNAQDQSRGRMEAGVYFYRIEAREGILRGRFVLTR